MDEWVQVHKFERYRVETRIDKTLDALFRLNQVFLAARTVFSPRGVSGPDAMVTLFGPRLQGQTPWPRTYMMHPTTASHCQPASQPALSAIQPQPATHLLVISRACIQMRE